MLLLIVVGCSNVQHNKVLEDSIGSIVEDNNITEIQLKSWTSFDWEKAFLFTPYTSQNEIEEQLGVHYNDQSDLSWRDDIYVFVFMKDEEAVQYVEIERHGADFFIGEKKYLTPTDDVIKIER